MLNVSSSSQMTLHPCRKEDGRPLWVMPTDTVRRPSRVPPPRLHSQRFPSIDVCRSTSVVSRPVRVAAIKSLALLVVEQ